MDSLRAIIDVEEMKSILVAEFARNPSLLDEVHEFLVENRHIHKPRALFNYLFIEACSATVGTVHPVVGFRLRDAQERRAAAEAGN